jgi:hypothetical protein
MQKIEYNIAVPSIFIVAPIGIENAGNLGEIPNFSVQNFMVNGIETFEELVANGIDINDINFLKSGSGESFPIIRNISEYTQKIINKSEIIIAATSLPSKVNVSIPKVAIIADIEKNTTNGI